MADEYVLIDCPNGHTFRGRIVKTDAKEMVLQQLICPRCGRRWESFSYETIDLTSGEV